MYIRFRIYDTYTVYDEYRLTENNIQKQSKLNQEKNEKENNSYNGVMFQSSSYIQELSVM